MKLTFVENVPRIQRKSSKHSLYDIIQVFINSDAKIAKIEIDETDYKRPVYCRNAMCKALKYWKQGGVTVHMRGNDVYLEKI